MPNWVSNFVSDTSEALDCVLLALYGEIGSFCISLNSKYKVYRKHASIMLCMVLFRSMWMESDLVKHVVIFEEYFSETPIMIDAFGIGPKDEKDWNCPLGSTLIF